jgi:rsbT co-antagonist protein RsbR
MLNPKAGDSLRALFDHLPDVVLITDESGMILQANEALSRMLGGPPAEGVTLAELILPEDRGHVKEALRLLASGQESIDLALRVIGGSKTTPLSCALRRAPERGEIYAVLRSPPSSAAASIAPGPPSADAGPDSYMGLTPAHREDLLEVLLEDLPFTVWIVDRDGKYVFNAGRGLDEIGLKPGQLVGLNIFELYESFSHEGSPMRRALKGERCHSVDESYSISWENWYLPVRDESGAVVRVVGASLNVTQAKRVEHELRAKLELIEQQRQVIRDLAAPIIEVWEGVLTVPLVGVFDSARAAEVTSNLLTEVTRRRARFTLLDLTGVEVIDTGTASHLLSMVRGIRLLGAEGILTGIRPAIAQTMVSLGIDIAGLVTLASLRDGLHYCMRRMQRAPS